jgi:GTP-binding protein EngB required for normal cell division
MDASGESTAPGRRLAPGSPLQRLAALADEAGASHIAAEAIALAERIRGGRFYVACMGQFKRGKSTLLNALVGEAVLPAGVVPVTTVVTVLRHGERRAARVRLAQGEWRDVGPSTLSAYVAEDENPENRKHVTGVEVFWPSPLLATGMCLVDTPGLGSVFTGASEATRAFVPHIDAAIVVIGGDPPISHDEVALVEEVAKQVESLVFVLNKADRLSDVERREATAFAKRVLADRLGRPVGPILEVSAAEWLAGAGVPRDRERLRAALESLARESGSQLVEAAEERGLTLLASRLFHDLDEQRGALSRPVEQSEERIASLKRCAAEAERSMSDLGYLFTAEQVRLGRRFAERRDSFMARALPAARAELPEGLRATPALRGPALRRRGFTLAQDIFKRWVDRWRAEEQPAGEQLYREAAQRFVELANGFLGRLADSGEAALASLPRTLGPEVDFRTKSGLYYTELMTLTSRSPVGWLVDLMRTRARAQRAVERGVGEYLERLLTANATRVTSDLDERVLESRRRLEAEVRACLREVYASAERALAAAKERRAGGKDAVEAELARLERLRIEIEAVLAHRCPPGERST